MSKKAPHTITIMDVIEIEAAGGEESLWQLLDDPLAVLASYAADGPVLIPNEVLDSD